MVKSISAQKPAPEVAAEYGPAIPEVSAPAHPHDEYGPIVHPTPPAPTYAGTGKASPLMGKTITLVTTANPKRPGSRTWARYKQYTDGLTTDEYLRLSTEGGLGTVREVLSDLNYDRKMGFIKLS